MTFDVKVSSFLLDITNIVHSVIVIIGHIHELYKLYTFTYLNYFTVPIVRWCLRCLDDYSLGLVHWSLTPPLVDFIQTISVIWTISCLYKKISFSTFLFTFLQLSDITDRFWCCNRLNHHIDEPCWSSKNVGTVILFPLY